LYTLYIFSVSLMYSFVSFKFYTSANKVYSFGCRVVPAECMPAADIRFVKKIMPELMPPKTQLRYKKSRSSLSA
ncbi:hypothetical protein, partial [Agathobacter sp.]|uniref:hypothetical protein n=1 Tax=Agathobacter sp. TaxID=2021311 RepID=UPI003AB44EE1